MNDEPPLVKLVHLILWQLEQADAQEAHFESVWVGRVKGSAPDSSPGQNLRRQRDYLTATHERKCRLRLFAHGEWRDEVAPSAAMFMPIIRRLCLLSDIHYWAKGEVTGSLEIKFAQRDAVWQIRSGNLDSGLTLSRVSDEPAAPEKSGMPVGVAERGAEVLFPPPRPAKQSNTWDVEDSEERRALIGMVGENVLSQFVDLIVYQAVGDRATQVVFEAARPPRTQSN